MPVAALNTYAEGRSSEVQREARRNCIVRKLLLMVPTFLGTASVTFTLCQFVPGGMIGRIRWQLFTGGHLGARMAFSGIRVQLGIPDEQPDLLPEPFGSGQLGEQSPEHRSDRRRGLRPGDGGRDGERADLLRSRDASADRGR